MPEESIHSSPEPYIGKCEFCDEGKLRIWLAGKRPVALCDECELYWEDFSDLAEDPRAKPSGSFPEGPCGADSPADWSPLSREEIEALRLSRFVIGESV